MLTNEQREQLQLIQRCDPSFLLISVKEHTYFDAALLEKVFELAKEQARALLAASAAPAEGREPTGSPNLTIEEDPRDGNWREFRVNGHCGFIRIVARMEEDEQDLPLGEQVAQFLLTASAKPADGENETTLRVLSSHAIRKHEGVTIFGDPAQVLKVMAAIESAGATGQEPVGVIERDEVNGWHMNALVDWEKIGVGTKLYAAPIGDNGANEVCSGCDGEKGYLVDGLPYTCTQCDGKGTAPQPAESKRVELTDEEIGHLRLIVAFCETLSSIEIGSYAYDALCALRLFLARASAKGA